VLFYALATTPILRWTFSARAFGAAQDLVWWLDKIIKPPIFYATIIVSVSNVYVIPSEAEESMCEKDFSTRKTSVGMTEKS
jgi:hypothetical protein